jgi:hypothetical protein
MSTFVAGGQDLVLLQQPTNDRVRDRVRVDLIFAATYLLLNLA